MELSIRKLRASLNKALQACSSVEAIKEVGDAFEQAHGAIWGCQTIYTYETFGDLYNAHMQRERENEDERLESKSRVDNIMKEIDEISTQKEYFDCYWFVQSSPNLSDNAMITDALNERREALQLPEEE